MSTVVAALDGSTAAPAVMGTATGIASLLGADVEALHVREGDRVPDVVAGARVPVVLADGDPVDEIVRALHRPEVVLGVLGARGEPAGPRPAGHVVTAVAERCDTPLLVVPPPEPDGDRGIRPIRRALVPLEGSAHSSACLVGALRDLADAGVELVGVHVFDTATVPRFWDQPAHAGATYATEFASRWCDEPSVEVRLARGPAAVAVIDAASAHDVDLIVLGWHRDLWRPGRAPVVRAALADAGVPVLLLSRSPPEGNAS